MAEAARDSSECCIPPEHELRDAVAANQAETLVLVWLQRMDDGVDRADPAALLSVFLRMLGAETRGDDDVWAAIEPGRAARHTAARCIARMYTRDPPQPLFQLVGTLLAATQSVRLERQVALFHVLAHVFRVHGAQLHSMRADAAAACVRTLRSAAAPPLAKAHALALLEQALAHGLPLSRDLQKTLRAALADRAGAVVRAAAACLAHERPTSRADADALVAAALRAAGSDPKTTRAVAHLAATALAQTDAPAADQLAVLHTHLARAPTWPARAAVLHAYHALFHVHGAAWVETHYADLARHVLHLPASLDDLAPGDAARLLAAARALARALGTLLRAPAQEGAAAALGAIVADWPAPTPTAQPPPDTALALALAEAAALITALGCIPPPLVEALHEPAVRALAHPAAGVRAHAAFCLGTAAHVHPALLSPTTTRLLGFVRRDVGALTAAQPDAGAGVRARLHGYSAALAALVHVAAAHPLYTSCADADDIFALATGLLEQAGGLPLAQAATAITTAWTLLAALFSFGPEYAKPRLPLFLTLWRNALGRAAGAAAAAPRGDAECAFLCHVRLNALAALLAFFAHGGAALLTSETSRRVVAALAGALQFVEEHVAPRAPAPAPAPSAALPGVLSARDAEPLLRARIFRCYAQLADNPAIAALHTQLLSLAYQSFARPERYAGSATQAHISASTGSVPSLWSARDNYAFGATSLVRLTDGTAHSGALALGAWHRASLTHALVPDMPVADYLDALDASPILGSLEHDTSALYTAPRGRLAAPVPAATAQVDAAVELFAALLPYAPRDAQIELCELLAASARSPSLDKNPGRRMAVLLNSTAALLGALRTSMHAATRGSGFANDRVSAACRSVAQAMLLAGDEVARASAAELYGRLAAAGGSPALGAQIHFLVEQIVDNRNADARASCARAAGEIYRLVGGLSAAPLTNTLSSLLMSLAADAHPAVHYAALDALCRIIEAAGLGFQHHVKSTLGLLARLYAVPSHEPEGGSAGSTNLRATLPVYAVLARTVGALVSVLGPELQQSGSRRALIGALLHQLVLDTQPPAADALEALQQLSLVVPGVFAHEHAMHRLLTFVHSGDAALQRAAVSAYYQLVQRGAHTLMQFGGRSLLATLLALVDAAPELHSARAVLTAWLHQSAPWRPVAWIDVCRTVLLVPGALELLGGHAGAHTAARTDTDDEDAVIQLDAAGGDGSISWRTHIFVLECVHDVLALTTDPAHVGRTCDAASPHSLASRVPDLIKIAVGASNAPHMAVRLRGLQVLRDVVERFHDTPDPAFPDTPLLEQSQAPITAALMPAFSSESTPEVLAAAVRVCATCITAGIERGGGRIERQLVAALEQTIRGSDTVGDVAGLVPAAAAYVHLAVLSAWADLQVAPHPPAMLAPHLGTLLRAWISALTQYAAAHLGAEPEAGAPIRAAHGVLAPRVSAQILHFCDSAWPRILQAVAVACTNDQAAVHDALEKNGGASTCIALYGLAFETLCDELGTNSSGDRTFLNAALSSLAVLVDVRYSGEFLLHTALYDELLELIQRALLVEDTVVQLGVIRVIRALVLSYRERLLEGEDSLVHDDALWSTKLGALLRAVHAYIARLPDAHRPVSDKAALLGAALHVSLDMAQVCTTSVQTDLVTILFGILADYVRREDDAAHMLPSVLPILRPLCTRACVLSEALGTHDMRRVVHGYLSAAINEADALRTRAGTTADAKRRNALVSVSLALVALDARIPISAAVIERFSFLLAQQLRTPAEALGALQCIRPIVQASVSSEAPSLRALVGMFVPPVIEYVAREHSDSDSDSNSDSGTEAAFEILHLFVRAVPESHRANALAITLPTFVVLAKRAGVDAPLVRTVCSGMVPIVHEHGTAFKTASAALDADDRALVHRALKCALNVSDAPTRAPRTGTSISLRTFGSQ